MTFECTLPLLPRGKGRPRFGRGRTYTDSKTAHFERSAAALMRHAMGPRKPFTASVVVHIGFYSPKPKKPVYAFPCDFDIDNLQKSVFDAGNGIVWTDDKIIREVHAMKLYGEPGITLRVEGA